MSGFVDATPANGDGDLSGGDQRGFAESFNDAYNSTYKAASQLGLDAEYDRVSSEQERRVFERTGAYLPDLPLESFAGNSGSNLARFYTDGGTPEQADAVSKYDGEIDKVRKQYPDLAIKNTRELWDQIQSEAQAAEVKDTQPRSFGGAVGGFLGGATAQFNPVVNPVNVATIGLGGVGKTVLGRVASEAGLQGGIQAIDELTGVAENRRLLGLEDGLSGSLERIGTAAAGGGLIRGAMEGIGAGFRRLRGSPPDDTPPALGTPEPPTPEVTAQAADNTGTGGALFKDYADFEAHLSASVKADAQGLSQRIADAVPFGRSRLAETRHATDLDNIEAQLNDFNHDGPWTLNNTAAHFEDPVSSEMVQPHWVRPAEEAIPALARQVDPELYAQIDKLDAMIADERAKLGATQQARQALPIGDVDAALAKADDLEVQIADHQARLAEVSDPRKVKRINRKIAELEGQQREIIKGLGPHADAVIELEGRTSNSSNRLAELERDRRNLVPLQKRAEDIAVDRYLSEKPSRENFEAMAKVLRADLRIPERQDVPELSQTRRPSEKATKAEGGGDDTPPGAPQRPATTSGPKTNEKAGETIDEAQRFLQDVTRRNDTNDKEVQGAFEAADAARNGWGTTTEIKSADIKAKFADAKGVLDMKRADEEIIAQVSGALKRGAAVTLHIEGKDIKIVDVVRDMMQDEKGQRWGSMAFHMPMPGKRASVEIKEPPSEVILGDRRYKLDDEIPVDVVRNDAGEIVATKTMTVRQLLDEIGDDADMLAAMRSCSL